MRTPAFVLTALALTACGEAQREPLHPNPPGPEPTAPEPVPTAAPTAAPQVETALPPADPTTPKGLAQLLLTDGAVAYSAAKKTFVLQSTYDQEGEGQGKRIAFIDEDGQKETLDVCVPRECDERKAAIVEKLGPSLAQRLESGGYTQVSTIAWPEGKDTLDLPNSAAKLRFAKDHFEILIGRRRPIVLPALTFKAPHAPRPSSIALAPDGAHIAVTVTFDPGQKYADGLNVYQETFVYKAPQ